MTMTIKKVKLGDYESDTTSANSSVTIGNAEGYKITVGDVIPGEPQGHIVVSDSANNLVDVFETSDMYLVAALIALGYRKPTYGLDESGPKRKVKFVFDSVQNSHLMQWTSHDLSVNARAFVDGYRWVTTAIHEVMDNIGNRR